MTKFEKIWCVSLFISEIGILLFWIFGFSGNLTVATYAFMIAGVSAFVALASVVASHLHKKRYGF